MKYGKKIVTFRIPIFCHNLKYDQAEIVKHIDKFVPPWQKGMEAIPQTINNLITFQVGIFQFKDSLRFLPLSLSDLVATLKPEDFKAIKRHPALSKAPRDNDGNPCDEDIELFKRKGIEAHSAMTGEHMFDLTEPLPRGAFYNELRDEHVSEEDHNHHVKFWKVTKPKNLYENYKNYCLTDTLLLADVFMAFSDDALSECGIEPAKYLSLADFTSEAEYSGK